ncbi:MAG: hypothetical protein GDA55_02130 [Cellvibrionales bacterium]|nr:hypothetical protein [Cellvibrionales bacterium]
MLEKADIVVTNPPFSLFREYMAQLIESGKKFLVIGNPNAITYKEIFPLIRDGKLWLGTKSMGTDMLFGVPEKIAQELRATKKEGSGYRIIDGELKGRAMAVWFTNLSHSRRNERLRIFRKYTPEEYPNYDNYNAIEVSKVSDIPCDYAGLMGVPISFLDKHNPDQFEIVGTDYDVKDGRLTELIRRGWIGKVDRGYLNGKRLYSRLFIRNLEIQ